MGIMQGFMMGIRWGVQGLCGDGFGYIGESWRINLNSKSKRTWKLGLEDSGYLGLRASLFHLRVGGWGAMNPKPLCLEVLGG